MGDWIEQLKQDLQGLKDFPSDVYSSIKDGTFRTKFNQARNRAKYGHSELTERDRAMNEFGNGLANLYAAGMTGIYAPMFIPVGKSNLATWGFDNLFMPKVGTNTIKWGTQLLGKIPQIGSRLGSNIGGFYTGLDAIGEAANTGLLGYWGYEGGKDLYDQASGKKPFSWGDTGLDLLGLSFVPSAYKEGRNIARRIGNEFFFIKKPGITASEGLLNGTPSRMIYRNGENPMTIIGNDVGEHIPRTGVRLTPKTGNTPVGNKLKSAMFDQEFYGKGPLGVTLKLDNATKKPNLVSGNYWKPKIPAIAIGATGVTGYGIGSGLSDKPQDEKAQSYYSEQNPEESIWGGATLNLYPNQTTPFNYNYEH